LNHWIAGFDGVEDEDRYLDEAKGLCEGVVSGVGNGLKGFGGDIDSVEVKFKL
jgi:hypothetical protein